jgi:DNA-binding transcriptional MerR regulator
MMKIGQLAKETGLSASRIRFYESIGLLKGVKRQSNGYRSYPAEAVTILGMITKAQDAGFSLDELKVLLPAELSEWDHYSLVEAIRKKLADIKALQKQLKQNEKQLREVLGEIEGKPHDMACSDNAQRVISQLGFGHKKE